MKILQVITELEPGGAERIVAELAREYTAHGHSADVAVLRGMPRNPSVLELLEKASARVFPLNTVHKFSPALPFRLGKLFRDLRPDIIHSHLIHPNILSRAAAAGTGIPLVNTIHISERRPGQGLFFLMDKITFPLADVCTAVSQASARWHERCCGLDVNSVRVVYNGSDKALPIAGAARENVIREWNLTAFDRCAGCVGRLDFQKGYDLLLARTDALSARIPEGEKWLLVFVGDGPEAERLHKIAETKKFPNLEIRFAGFRPDAASLMDLFDVFCMPSRYEGYGLALTEAMSFGLPVVCSDADSLPELCARYPGTSFHIPMEQDVSGERMADALVRAASSPRTDGFVFRTVRQMAEDYLGIYGDLLSAKRKKR